MGCPQNRAVTTTGPHAEVGIRQAERADLLSVFRIEKQSFPQPWPYAAFEQYLDARGFLVAEDGRELVGYVVADSVPNHGTPIGHIKDLAVASERRHEGIGQSLLTRALSELLVEGVDRVKLEVRENNEAARSLYESFGFELHHVVSNYYDDGENAHVMVREISSGAGILG
jgi:ribosomal-protein-alanine N-acetyltransferase